MAKIKQARVKVSWTKDERAKLDELILNELAKPIERLAALMTPELPAEMVEDADILADVTEAAKLLVARSIRRVLKNGKDGEDEDGE